MTRRVLAAVDQSPWAYLVFRRAVELARLLDSELTLLSVVNPNPMMIASQRNEVESLNELHRKLVFKSFPGESVKLETNPGQGTLYKCGPSGLKIYSRVENGDPVDRICRCADEENVDLVIVGNRGLGGVGAFVLGSVSEKVVRKSTRTVMVVKGAGSIDGSDWERIGNAPKATQHLTR